MSHKSNFTKIINEQSVIIIRLFKPSSTQPKRSKQFFELCSSKFTSTHLHSRGHFLWKLHIKTFLAGVQAVNNLLVFQFAGADHESRQVAPEVLSHAGAATYTNPEGDRTC